MCERLPTERVFLIRLSSSAESSTGIYCGRIEHVRTGRVTRFSSLAEIEQFITEILAGADSTDQESRIMSRSIEKVDND